jgi:transposase InsO family protein
MSTRIGAGPVRARYEFIKAHRDRYSVRTMCRLLDVAPSGYYKWLKEPLSDHAQEDARLFGLTRASFVASQGIYGAPRVFLDLREAGETCSKHRVARLMRENNLRARHGYRTRRSSAGKPSVLIPNLLQRESRWRGQIGRGSRISPTFGRGKGGSTWQRLADAGLVKGQTLVSRRTMLRRAAFASNVVPSIPMNPHMLTWSSLRAQKTKFTWAGIAVIAGLILLSMGGN